MRLMQLRLPIRAAVRPTLAPAATSSASTTSRATLPSALPAGNLLAANAAVEGHRFAAVKAQGAYKEKNKKPIAKKMGAKRVGEQYVLPGTIIYKQRGTIWHAGENTILGRDHTIHAAVAGYVKYYRDPYKYPPGRQYIGVTFERHDTLPYPPHTMRKRRLGMKAIPIKVHEEPSPVTRSGIPRVIVRRPGTIEATETKEGDELNLPPTAAEKKATVESLAIAAAAAAAAETTPNPDKPETKARRSARRWNAYIRVKRSHRTLYVGKNYQYRESYAEIGRLLGKHKGKTAGTQMLGSRKGRFRARRRRQEERLALQRNLLAQQKVMMADAGPAVKGKGKAAKAKPADAASKKGKKGKNAR